MLTTYYAKITHSIVNHTRRRLRNSIYLSNHAPYNTNLLLGKELGGVRSLGYRRCLGRTTLKGLDTAKNTRLRQFVASGSIFTLQTRPISILETLRQRMNITLHVAACICYDHKGEIIFYNDLHPRNNGDRIRSNLW